MVHDAGILEAEGYRVKEYGEEELLGLRRCEKCQGLFLVSSFHLTVDMFFPSSSSSS